MPPVPPSRYARLHASPNWIRHYEPQSNIPLSQANQALPYTSPFTLSILPPLVLQYPRLASTSTSPFDPLLADQRALIAQNNASLPLDQQSLALLGTRTPLAPTSNIVETALKAHSNFSKSKQRQSTPPSYLPSRYDDSNLPNLDPLVSSQGQRFNPLHSSSSRASNQNAIANVSQARSAHAQSSTSIPPLTLLVNPQSLVRTYTKKQSYSDRSRFNYIFQPWGEDLPTLSIQGKTGAYIAAATPENSRSGVQWATRRDSLAYQELTNILTLYRNNGTIYNPDGSEAHLYTGSVQIEYDQMLYQGNFTSFSYAYHETNQLGGIEFSLEMTLSAIFDGAPAVDVAPLGPPGDPTITTAPSQPAPLPTTNASSPSETPPPAQSALFLPILR